jgi:hypothetical protein
MATAPYNPAIYSSLATSYAQAGQSETANAILIERQNAEFKNTKSWIDKGYLFVIWLLADYGHRPELGLVWIAGFVLLAAVIQVGTEPDREWKAARQLAGLRLRFRHSRHSAQSGLFGAPVQGVAAVLRLFHALPERGRRRAGSRDAEEVCQRTVRTG